MTNNEAIARRAEAVIPGGLLSPSRRLGAPIAFSRADGPYLYDADGNRYTDYHCAFGANVLGHRNPAIFKAIADVNESVDLIGAGVLELEVEVAELLVRAIPCADQVAFCSRDRKPHTMPSVWPAPTRGENKLSSSRAAITGGTTTSP